ncbi:hydroxyethylthiazole kinase [Corynebacterium anserum]|uniref:Hydroxyethylthiazole kinase n=1 Tax=Corynebacterium anserum TaxID=2684406 RepID=A0A7G7YM93_9CORY|nr:hydroxyethylthiazole kinase [Corynebacterium anserum]MBC2680969.1 hydroxyethylthiazole kinase [Corynebacterium anserum]QNH95613.1 hydroxyethylthiazole kinase [Corynebacterium anserum]
MHVLSCAIEQMRRQAPLVQCLTNSVVMEVTANVLLAAGAQPAMVDTPEESFQFAQLASGVLLNSGTPSAHQYEGMREAVRGAREADTPWVLDPVGAGALQRRTEFLHQIVTENPTAIRGNASEIIALAGMGHGGRGVDSTDGVEAAAEAARALARTTGGVVAVSGPKDLIVSEGRVTWVHSGHAMLQKVIGTGCSLGALTAAYLGVTRGGSLPEDDGRELSHHDLVVAAHAHTGAAAQLAMYGRTQSGKAVPDGPGTFAAAWLDGLFQLTPEEMVDLVSIEETTEEI